MKIISTFLWSEEFEQNCLEIKLNCESECVEEWIAVESNYTFRGEYKGCSLFNVLSQQKFDKFRSRITIIPIVENLFEKLCTNHNEKNYFLVEFASRAACWDYVSNKYGDDTRVLVGDVDEVVDFSDLARRDRIFQIFKEKDRGVQLPQAKYWWGMNNLSFYPKYMPIHTIKSLRNRWTSFTHRNNNCEVINSDLLLCMEYAYSFSAKNCFRKCSSFSHDRYSQECIDNALLLNSWHRCLERNERLGADPYDWFETVEITENNSPKFILDNFDRLNPNTVNPDYAQLRARYGIQPHPALNYGFLGPNKIAKQCNYYKR